MIAQTPGGKIWSSTKARRFARHAARPGAQSGCCRVLLESRPILAIGRSLWWLAPTRCLCRWANPSTRAGRHWLLHPRRRGAGWRCKPVAAGPSGAAFSGHWGTITEFQPSLIREIPACRAKERLVDTVQSLTRRINSAAIDRRLLYVVVRPETKEPVRACGSSWNPRKEERIPARWITAQKRRLLERAVKQFALSSSSTACIAPSRLHPKAFKRGMLPKVGLRKA